MMLTMRTSRTNPAALSRLSLAAITLVIAFTLTQTPRASAHAAYVESTPAFSEILNAAPSQVVLRFSQELFRRDGANTVTLQQVGDGGALTTIALGAAQIDNADRRTMSAEVRETLEAGRYRVSWTNLSSEDGDADSGWYHFYVGRHPTASEQAEDREQAQALLVTYPGDEAEDEGAAAETGTQTVVNVVRADDRDGGGVGAGPIVWLAAGALAALAVAASLARQRRAA